MKNEIKRNYISDEVVEFYKSTDYFKNLPFTNETALLIENTYVFNIWKIRKSFIGLWHSILKAYNIKDD